MIILALDPSSTCTGWALVYAAGTLEEVPNPTPGGTPEVLDHGRILPTKMRATALVRTLQMAHALEEMGPELDRKAQETMAVGDRLTVVEIPGRAQAGRQNRQAAALSVYAFAAGFLANAGRRAWDAHLVGVESSEWTRTGAAFQQSTKAGRKIMAAALAPGYDPAKDSGGDESDAVCLGVWAGIQTWTREGRTALGLH